MDFEQQDKIRTHYSLITRGALSLRNWIQALISQDEYFQQNEEAREKIKSIIRTASAEMQHHEIDALVGEFGPEVKKILG